MNTQVAGLTLIVAQETDQTGRQITTMIVVLLVIAVILAFLTAWYWKHTDPRRRAMLQAEANRASRDAEEVRRAQAGEPAVEAVQRSTSHPAGTEARHDPVWAGESAERGGVSSSESGMSSDEWLRLTGPASRPAAQPTNGRNGSAGADETKPMIQRDSRPQQGFDGTRET